MNIKSVREILGDGVKEQFGAMIGVEGVFHAETLSVHTTEENRWDRAEVTLSLDADIYGEEVSGYYISYSSRWQSAEYAERMSVLIGGVAMIAKKLEAAGLKCTK